MEIPQRWSTSVLKKLKAPNEKARASLNGIVRHLLAVSPRATVCVRPVWGNFIRVNIFEVKGSGLTASSRMIRSVFCRLLCKNGEYLLKDMTDDLITKE